MGRPIMPHVFTFSGMLTTLSRAYRNPDEALQHSVENANMMLSDPSISGPLFARQKMVSLLNWHIEPEDPDNQKLAAVAEKATKILNRTPRFTEYRRALGQAVWTGRHANQHKYGFHVDSRGKRTTVIRNWIPIDGDKLVFRYDGGTGEFDSDEVGVRVSPAHVRDDVYAGKWQVEYFAHGSAVFWEKWERERICLHKYFIQDAPFEEPDRGGSIHGLGLRNYLYWVWYQKQETLAKMMELVERSALGFTIYWYEDGNPTAKAEMRKVAQEQAHTNAVLLPRNVSNPMAGNEIQQIPPNTQGIEALRVMIDDYFGDQITRMILGQTLSTKAQATGLGSGLSDLHMDSLKQIVKYDAVNLEETLTTDLLKPLIKFNMPRYSNHDFWVRISTEAAIPKEELEAIQMAYKMGAKIKTEDLLDRIGISRPGDEEEFLLNPQVRLGQQQAEMQDMQMEVAMQQPMMPQAPVEEEPLPQEKEEDSVAKLFGPILNRKCPQRNFMYGPHVENGQPVDANSKTPPQPLGHPHGHGTPTGAFGGGMKRYAAGESGFDFHGMHKQADEFEQAGDQDEAWNTRRKTFELQAGDTDKMNSLAEQFPEHKETIRQLHPSSYLAFDKMKNLFDENKLDREADGEGPVGGERRDPPHEEMLRVIREAADSGSAASRVNYWDVPDEDEDFEGFQLAGLNPVMFGAAKDSLGRIHATAKVPGSQGASAARMGAASPLWGVTSNLGGNYTVVARDLHRDEAEDLANRINVFGEGENAHQEWSDAQSNAEPISHRVARRIGQLAGTQIPNDWVHSRENMLKMFRDERVPPKARLLIGHWIKHVLDKNDWASNELKSHGLRRRNQKPDITGHSGIGDAELEQLANAVNQDEPSRYDFDDPKSSIPPQAPDVGDIDVPVDHPIFQGDSKPVQQPESQGAVDIPERKTEPAPPVQTAPERPGNLELGDQVAKDWLEDKDQQITSAAAGVYDRLLQSAGQKLASGVKSAGEAVGSAVGLGTEVPKAPPEPQLASPPQAHPKWWGEGDRPTAEHLQGLPSGSTIGGWTKVEHPHAGSLWTQGDEARSSEALAGQDIDFGDHFNPHERINQVAGAFGMRFGDPGGPEAQKFLTDAARRTGYTPTGTEDALDHLERQQAQLNQTVAWARELGLNPQSNNLIDNARSAGTHLMKEAVEGGYRPQSNDPQENLAGAMQYLAEHGAPSQEGALAKLQRMAGGKMNFWLMAGGLLAMAWISGMFDRRR